MNTPILICKDSFQTAWASAIMELKNNRWRAWNLMVQINQPELFDSDIDNSLKTFATKKGLIIPKHVAYTIFPHTLYRNTIERELFYKRYMRFFKWSRSKPNSGWGTYFERMIEYETPKGMVDQLGSIIDNISNRTTNYGASYTIVIPYPHKDINKIMGAPCLNYITIQVEYADDSRCKKVINLFAVYRNHDFTERAYGNYWGLCNLLKYISYETSSLIGTLTCVSSHADVPNHKSELVKIANDILGESHG